MYLIKFFTKKYNKYDQIKTFGNTILTLY